MKAVSKTNKLAKEERERARDKKSRNIWGDSSPMYSSPNSHKKTNKRK
jgi:hypothetical protein